MDFIDLRQRRRMSGWGSRRMAVAIAGEWRNDLAAMKQTRKNEARAIARTIPFLERLRLICIPKARPIMVKVKAAREMERRLASSTCALLLMKNRPFLA